MTYNRMVSDLDATKAQLAVFFVIILLSVDSLNPIKIFLYVFPQVAPWHIATMSFLAIVYIFVSEMKQLIYFAVKVYFNGILSIFFQQVEVIGRNNIPPSGPVIFTGNHGNQFVDGLVVMCTCEHTLSHMIAAKSWFRPVVGHLAWAMGCVPVKRGQDTASEGSGLLLIKTQSDELGDPQLPPKIEVTGKDTKFISEVLPGDRIRIVGNRCLKVLNVESNTKLFVEGNATSLDTTFSDEFITFEVMKRVDQSSVYDAVLSRLGKGGAIGIFPEGGSHDRTDILPLKVGVALIGYSTLERDGLIVPIVPVGLNYFRGHRFRGRVIVEYGAPIYIDPGSLDSYKAGGTARRKVCEELLERISDSMRSVLVTTPDYQSLKLVHAARRLHQRKIYSSTQKQDLNRRFAEGYKLLLLHSKGNPPPEWLEIQQRVVDYQNELDDIGIRDYQVVRMRREEFDSDGDLVLQEMRISLRIIKVVVVFLLAFLPVLVLNLPVGAIARVYAEKKRKKALAASKVKILARDVMLSEKIVFSIVCVPTLWFIYGALLVILTNLDGPSITLAVLSMPLFSYLGVVATEAGMIGMKDLRPPFMYLFPSTRRRLQKLPIVRKELQRDLRQLIKELGPVLGEVYYNKEIDWAKIQEKTRVMKKQGEIQGFSLLSNIDGMKSD